VSNKKAQPLGCAFTSANQNININFTEAIRCFSKFLTRRRWSHQVYGIKNAVHKAGLADHRHVSFVVLITVVAFYHVKYLRRITRYWQSKLFRCFTPLGFLLHNIFTMMI
jgi:hypothetical protein